jgi:hypothetical protein
LKRVAAFLAVSLILGSISSVRAEVLAGPALTEEELFWHASGLRIEALRNVTLMSVRYPNQGLGAAVELRNDANAVLMKVDVIGTPSATVVFNYPLIAGNRYKLVALSPGNNRYAGFSSFPLENSDLRVLSSWSAYTDPNGIAQTNSWMAFNDLETSDPSFVDSTTWSKIKSLYR